MLRTIESDRRYTYLATAAGKASTDRSELEQRFVLTLRFLNRATVMIPPPVRIATQGLALEVLLSDGSDAPQAHLVAKRAAYVTCGYPGDPHGLAGRKACPILALRSERQLRTEVGDARARGRPAWCEAYANVMEIAMERNNVMHEGKEDFPRQLPARFEGWVDGVILGLVDWSIASTGTTRAALDAEIHGLVNAGVEWWSH